MTTPTPLDPQQRAEAWRRIASQDLDVLVIGGGVTGAGVATLLQAEPGDLVDSLNSAARRFPLWP